MKYTVERGTIKEGIEMGIAFGETELGQAMEQWELEYGVMTPKQKFIFRAGWNAGRVSLR